MSPRARVTTLAVFLAVLGRTAPADAHRLDEYLQATLLAIDRDRVTVEINLTAGVSVAPRIFASIDGDRDGRISAAEGDYYARQILRSLALAIDDRPVALGLEDEQFPGWRAMSLGVGAIRLRAVANVPPLPAGRHRLRYLTPYRSDVSVYLVNALLPADRGIEIAAQQRDAEQRSLTLDYDVTPDARRIQISWLLCGLGMVGMLVLARRTRVGGPARARSNLGLYFRLSRGRGRKSPGSDFARRAACCARGM